MKGKKNANNFRLLCKKVSYLLYSFTSCTISSLNTISVEEGMIRCAVIGQRKTTNKKNAKAKWTTVYSFFICSDGNEFSCKEYTASVHAEWRRNVRRQPIKHWEVSETHMCVIEISHFISILELESRRTQNTFNSNHECSAWVVWSYHDVLAQ